MDCVPEEISMSFENFCKKYSWVFLVLFAVIVLFVACTSVIFLSRNHPAELEVEKIIEQENGCHVDLTP